MYSKTIKDSTRTSPTKRERLYKIANSTWTLAGWLWSTVIIVFLVSFAANVASAEAQKDYYINTLIRWLSTPSSSYQEFYRIAVLLIVILFVAITLLSMFLRQLLKPSSPSELQELLVLTKKDMEATQEREAAQKVKDEEGFKQYLRSMKEMNQNISPKGLAQHSRTLVFTDVQLDDVFVHPQVISDRPIFDIPQEQQRQLQKIQQRTDPSDQEREDYIQRLRFAWYSQLRQENVQAQQQLPIAEVLRRLYPRNPVAIILGTPGSGKTTFLRWVAYHLSYNLISSDTSSSTNGSAPKQVPILIRINDYAEWLDKEPVTLRQFLIIRLSEIHPNAPAKVLDALEHGRCLVLFDGLDEGFSPKTQRHVTDAIHSFIIDHSVEDPQTHLTNSFIITSRITDYQPEVFARYAHYTLPDLDDQQIEHFLAKWFFAIELDMVVSERGAQHLRGRETKEVGVKHRERLLSILKTSPGFKRLATNPLALTIMAFIQANGRDLLRYRFDLYKLVTYTLLDTWNQESGRKMFPGEEIPLVEDLLGRFANRLQNDDGILSGYDVEMITRQTMAEFYHLQAHEVTENDIAQLVETLRRSSGLFAEVGDDLFCFANQTFQDFFAALYLLRRPKEERKQLAVKHFLSTRWSEPLLLMLIYKSARNSRDEQREISEILQSILDTPGDNSTVVQRNLLFVMSSIVNGRLLVTDKALIERICNNAERIAQQQSAHIREEERNLIETLLHQFNSQNTEEKTPTRPLKRPEVQG